MSPASPFCSRQGLARTISMAGIPPTSTSPATQTLATTTPGCPTKPPHGHPVNLRSPLGPEPRQIWNLELEEEEPHSDTAVDTTTVGSSEPLATLPKDNDDNGSEYAASSDEDPVPAERRRESARLRGVRAPTPHLSRSPVSEGRGGCRGRKRSLSRSEESVSELSKHTLPVTPGERRASKRQRESNVQASQKHTHKPAHRVDGVGRTGTSSGVVHSDVVKRMREHNRSLSASSSRQVTVSRALSSTVNSQKRAASSQEASRTTPPEPVTGAGSPKPKPPDDASAAVKQFLSDIGLGQSHLQILLQEGIRTKQDLDGLQQMEKECMVELRDVLRTRGFTPFEFSKVEYAISRRKD